MSGWKIAAMGVADGDRNFQIGGIAIWSKTWEPLPDKPVRFREPLYGQWHRFDVYQLEGLPQIRFAATELSNCVWGFLVPSPSDEEREDASLSGRLTPLQKQMLVGFVLGVLTVIVVVAMS